MANYGGRMGMGPTARANVGIKGGARARNMKKSQKATTFKNCATCPTPAACRRAGKCLKKRMMGQR